MARMKHSFLSHARAIGFGVAFALMAACSGGDDSTGGGGATTVAVSGRITFDRVPFKTQLNAGLNFSAPLESPARQVVVEAIDAGSSVILASTTTDVSGNYSLDVPANRNLFIRAKAQMLKTGTAPTWNFRILNNTNGDTLYALDGAVFNSGNTASTRSLRAESGWGVTSYSQIRAAAPFAILDTMHQVKALILSAKADTAFPALDLFWSTSNRQSSVFCPDAGNIVSSLYTVFSTAEPDDLCSPATPGKDGIYVLGDFNVGDTDEFDQHVIAHEAGHYFEDRFSRSDSIGGEHSLNDFLDLRLAFGEGWGDAFGAMVLNDPVYRDSYSGANQDFGFNLESSVLSAPGTSSGWHSELSVFKVLWDVFDPANETTDTVALGFGPIHSVMTGAQSTTSALTSIFPFARALKASNPASAAGIDALLAAEGIRPISDEFGTTETNFVGGQDVVPIYTDISSGTPQRVCSSARTVVGASNGKEYNSVFNRRFLRFVSTSARTVSISVSVASSGSGPISDPDFVLWRQGTIVYRGWDEGVIEIQQVPLQAGTYVLEIYDYNHVDLDATTGTGTTCMSVSIAG